MLFNDTYKTIAQPAEGIFKDKGSKFIAYAYPIKKEAELKPILSKLKKEHSKARHFCWAYRLSTDRNIFRINDDGEPAGTAGKPILNTLYSNDLTYILVVVVRYFGGTLLGVPGLINAYKQASTQALTTAQIIHKTINDVYQISFNYLTTNNIIRIVKEVDAQIINQTFDSHCTLTVEVRKNNLNTMLDRLTNIANTEVKYLYTL